jgi:hypothetical protein
VNVLSNVIAPDDFHDLITFDSMRRQYTSTRIFPVIPSPQLGLGSKGKFALIVFDLRPAVHEHQQWAVKEAIVVDIVGICPLPALPQCLLPQVLVEKMSFVVQHL